MQPSFPLHDAHADVPRAELVDLDERTLREPFDFYASLRAKPGLPRHRRQGYRLVARYDDIREAAMRTEDFSSTITESLVKSTRLGPLFEGAMGRLGPVDVLAVVDAPRHLVHRKLATRHFGRDPVAALVAELGPRIDRRIDRLVASGGGEFIGGLAGHLPAEAALTLLGFPEADAPRVKAMSDASVALLSGVLPKQERTRSFAGALALYAYSAVRFAYVLRRGGTGTPLGDAIVSACREGEISERESASIVMQLLVAGSDSTASLLGSAVRMLADRPTLADELRKEPTRLVPFVEEVMRLESPFQGHFRFVRHDTELASVKLAKGERLMLLWAAGNRDPSAFDRPDEVVLDRRRGERTQLAFGYGPHLCLGAGVARAISRRVLESLLERTSSIELVESEVDYRPSGFVRTLTRLPVALSR